MTATEEKPAKSPIAARLGPSMVAIRPDIEISRHVFGAEVHYLARDPMNFSTHRFSAEDYAILVRIDRRLTLEAIFVTLVDEGLLAAADEERLFEFVVSLHRIGFLDLPIPDEKRLYERHLARRRAQRMQRLMSVFFLPVPLWNPDPFLQRTRAVARAMYSLPAFVVWVVLQGLALSIVFNNLDRLIAPISQVLVAGNLPVLWGTLVGLKVVHEMGHAWACKRFGGQVPEMGLYLIAGTPCAYVDATASWGFSSKMERIIVCFGGMYFELTVAAVATLVWATAESEMARSIAYNVMFLASFATLMFNANPMMKSDGYFALSDILEVPNLRARATAWAAAVGKRLVLGLPLPRDPAPLWQKALFVTFGVVLPFYRFGVVTGLALTVALKFFALGVALAGLYCLMEFWKITVKLFRLFFIAAETSRSRPRAVAIGCLVFLILPIVVAGLPLPDRSLAPAVVRAENEIVLRADSAGFLEPAPAFHRQEVMAAEPIAELIQPGLPQKLIQARAAVAEGEIRLGAAEVREPVLARRERESLAGRREELTLLESRLEACRLLAPESGILVLSDRNLLPGTWLAAGQEIGRVMTGNLEAVVLLTEEEFEGLRPEIGDVLRFQPAAGGEDIPGTLTRIARAGSHEITELALSQVGGGEILVDASSGLSDQVFFELRCRFDRPAGFLPRGATGRVLFHGRAETMGRRGLRKILNLVNRVRHGSL